MKGRATLLVLVLVLLASVARSQVTETTVPIYNAQHYPWHQSILSRDGTTVVGVSTYQAWPPEKWTPAGGVVKLPSLGKWVAEITSIDGVGDVFLGSAVGTPVGTSPRIYFFGSQWYTTASSLFLQDVSYDGRSIIGTQKIGTSGAAALVRLVSFSPSSGTITPLAGTFLVPNVYGPIVQTDAKADAVVMTDVQDTNGNHFNYWSLAGGLQHIVPTGFSSADLDCITPDGAAVGGRAFKNDTKIHGFVQTIQGRLYDLGIYAPSHLSNGILAITLEGRIWSPSLGFTDMGTILTRAGSSDSFGAYQMSDDTKAVLSIGSNTLYYDALGTIPSLVAPYDVGTWFNVKAGTPLNIPAPGLMAFVKSDTAATTSLLRKPLHAKAFSVGTDGSFSYTPADGFVGTDSFTFKATNFGGDGNAATVRLFVQ